jgi:hypothetical protein
MNSIDSVLQYIIKNHFKSHCGSLGGKQIFFKLSYLQTEYLALADQLSDYVVKLLDKVRGHDELEKLINKKRRDPHDESYDLLARLHLAIQCNEKKVSHWDFITE